MIPLCVSCYLVAKHRIYVEAALGIAVVALVCHLLAQPVRGMGIALPVFVPTLVTACTALLISRQRAAPIAYVAAAWAR